MEAPKDGVDNGIVGGVKRLDGEIGKRIDRRPLFEQPTQRLFRVRSLQQRPIGFLAHPGEQNVKARLQPDRDAMLRDIFARGRIHERAAACRQHHRSAGEQARNHLALAFAEISLAEPLEDLRNGQLSARFDLGIGIDERQSKLCRQPFADRGFSGPHHADKNDRAPGKRRRHLSGVDRLALTHKPRKPRPQAARAVPYKTAGGECESDAPLRDCRPQPSCAARPVLATMSPHDSRSVAVDNADAKTQGAVDN